MASRKNPRNKRPTNRRPPNKQRSAPGPRSKQNQPSDSRGSVGEARRTGGIGGERVEGRQAVRELLLGQTRRVRGITFQSGMDEAPILQDIRMLAEDARVSVRELGRQAFNAMAETDSSQGVLADAHELPVADLDDLLDEPLPFFVMLDGVTDPHNLGAMIRSADAAGATAVIVGKHRSARVTATVTKSAAGAVEHVPLCQVSGVPAAISKMQDKGVWVLGLDERGRATVFDSNLADQPICLVFGAEGAGLSRLTRDRCDQLVSIPMQGAVASLNVSAAAAVAMFDVTRRRLGK